MRHSNITATLPIKNQLVLKKSKFTKMVKTTSKKSYVKASDSKRMCKPPPGDKIPGLEISIRLYAIEDGNKTE